MAKQPLRGRPKGPVMANELQSLTERLKWLRQHQEPYMTQQQLADLSGISRSFIADYERGYRRHMSTDTIQKLAAALRVRFTIRLMRLSDREIMECQPPSPPPPFSPKQTHKLTAEARAKAAKREYSPWSVYRQHGSERSRKLSAGIANSASGKSRRKSGSHPKRPGKPLPRPQIP